jgi:UDP-N-acetylglucosamine 2-epimerase (non-hydrolysing)
MANKDAGRVMLVFGTRPEAVKMAPVAIALGHEPDLEPVITVTAQHRTMLDQVLEVFGLAADFDLNIFQSGQGLADITARAITSLDQVMEQVRPDAVLVQGDTTTTFAGALCGFYHRIPVVHLEAGLRTGQPYSPYPEEINRRLTGQLSTMHLAATVGAKANLLAEGIPRHRIVVTGNTVVDALLWVLERPRPPLQPALADLDNERGEGAPMLLVTAHRRESWGDRMQSIGRALREIADARPDVVVVVPLHPNPIVRGSIVPEVAGAPNIRLVEPLSYPEFAVMLRRAHLVLTDSGGVQEEAPSLRTPVLIMRETTERPEAVAAGTAKLVGTGSARITEEVLRLLGSDAALEAMTVTRNPFGDGRATSRVVAALHHIVSAGELPPDFA